MTQAEKIIQKQEQCFFRQILRGYDKEQLIEIIVDLVGHDKPNHKVVQTTPTYQRGI